MPIQKEKACKSTALKNIKYITNPEKTIDENGKRWVETYNMITDDSESPEKMYAEFKDVNKLWNKNKSYDERKYYHTVINFKGIENVTPKMAMTIGKCYLKQFYPKHQSVLAVHLDKKYCHIHICTNSVNMETGKKIDRTDKDLIERKDYVNHISYELYGIEPFNWRAAVRKKREQEKNETLEVKGDNYNYAEQQMHKNNRVSELDKLREKILRTALESTTREEFEKKLRDKYNVSMPRNTEKTVSFKYNEGKKGIIRGRTLGEYYTAEFIDKILFYNLIRKNGNSNSNVIPDVLNDMEEIAYERNYELAQKYGFEWSRIVFESISEPEIMTKVSVHILKEQKVSGIQIYDNQLYISGVKVETDKRLQMMFDANFQAARCQNQYGCKSVKEFEEKKDNLESQWDELNISLHKERKIEKELKKKLQKNENLYHSFLMVYNGTGTVEEQKHARYVLYRNGYKKEEFDILTTLDKITEELNKSKNNVEKQSQKLKEIYADKMRTQNEIDKFVFVLDSVKLANNPKFYYGNDLDKCFEPIYEKEQSNTEKEYSEMSVNELIEVVQERANVINSNIKEPYKTQEIEKS
ncbi:MAG: relaxase/mobilization nuclease domain-containing protein [Clostridia bacterium]|nr:relaxase/mobilization nuclease domain-containing protein [Clostridia bacterium]